jgi:hypothetical protein
MVRPEGIGTVFSVLAGVAVGFIWGVSLGLLAAAAGGMATLAIWSCRSRNASERVADGLDPALEIRPAPDRLAAGASEEAKKHIRHFVCNQVEERILGKSPHFNNRLSLVDFLTERFNSLDGNQLSVVSVNPVRLLEEGVEAYEVTIRSREPNGWIRCYVPKQRPGDVRPNGANVERIARVSPFLDREEAEENHLRQLLSFLGSTKQLRQALFSDCPQSDLTQVRLRSLRSARFVYAERLYDGCEMELEIPSGPVTPSGPVRYYALLNGSDNIARPSEVRDYSWRSGSASPAGR